MISAEIGKQLMIHVDNSVGSLAQVTSVVSSSGINLVAICAYEVKSKVAIMFVTADNNEAKNLLRTRGFNVQEEEVILLSVDNRPGALQRITDKLADGGVNLRLIYGSAEKEGKVSRIVLIADDNLEAMMIIKTELERNE